MVELEELVMSFALLAIGTIMGALITYWFSIRQEKKQKSNRKLEVARAIVTDLSSRLLIVKSIREDVAKLLASDSKREEGDTEWMKDAQLAFNRDIFISLLPELPLLPFETLFCVITFYNIAEIDLKRLWRYLELQDKLSLEKAKILCESVLDLGKDALSPLLVMVRNIGIDEARQVVNELLKTDHKNESKGQKK